MDVAGMTRQLTASCGRIKRAWAVGVRHLREANSVEAIEARLTAAAPLVGVGDVAQHFAAAQHAAYVQVGQATARWLDAQLEQPAAISKKLVGFDISDPVAVAWARANTLAKIRQITDDQRALIREILINGARTSANPRAMAQQIRDSIGLTDAQYRMVVSYRAALERGAYAAALDRQLSSGVSDRVIAAALRDKRVLTPAQIDAAVARYLANAIAMRATTIARTEGLRVTHQGNEELFRQALSRGDVAAEQVERTWATSHLANVRNSHRAMDKQVCGVGETFVSGAGVELAYPGDPDAPASEVCNCECVVATRIRPPNRPGS